MDHNQEMKRVSKLSYDALLFNIKDCQEAIDAMPDNPKAGDYADTISYCSMALRKLRDKARG